MQDTNKNFGEMMKNIAYLTEVAEKGNSSLKNKKCEHVLLKASIDNRIHIQELQHENGKSKGVRIEEGDVLGSSAAKDWQRRPSFTHQILEIPYVDNREQRRPWTNGNYDPSIIDERQDQRGLPEFNM
ncbi:hypothetical protein FH972_005849 [Carpinus fangiana]|uniref:Uncharacterized protein n=1 Tax=Carpinus fangiana TaxID=176857 RepID=A0A5N6QU07_9ROSI|nr:hypothetical protein FH972_005849 [Carpinus fangiana]